MFQFLFFALNSIPVFSDVGLAPHLQPAGADNGGAFRGVLGSCEKNLSLYHAFIPSDQPYHCDLAGVELDFKKKYYPAEELCDWGFGELIPQPTVGPLGKLRWLPGGEWGRTPGSQIGTTPAEKMFHSYGCVMSGSAILGGSSNGRNIYKSMCLQGQKCGNGSISCCNPIFSNVGLTYPSSMGIYKINPAMKTFIQMWRATYHRPNINFGLGAEYYAGWIRKVVRCADIPARLLDLNHMVSSDTIPTGWNESEIGYALRTWLGMESLLTADNLTASFLSPPDWPEPIIDPVEPSLSVIVKNGKALVTISGDATKWFSVGFGAYQMQDSPDTLVIYADGRVEERKLAQYSPGGILKLEFTLLSNSVINGTRTVTLSRSVTGSSPDRFTFPSTGSPIQYIWAAGMQATELVSHEWSGLGSIIVGKLGKMESDASIKSYYGSTNKFFGPILKYLSKIKI